MYMFSTDLDILAAFVYLCGCLYQVRSLKEELSSRSSRVTHLEFALKAKDREVGRAKEEKEAARAAERERTKVRVRRLLAAAKAHPCHG
jgi:hypothetical protein